MHMRMHMGGRAWGMGDGHARDGDEEDEDVDDVELVGDLRREAHVALEEEEAERDYAQQHQLLRVVCSGTRAPRWVVGGRRRGRGFGEGRGPGARAW